VSGQVTIERVESFLPDRSIRIEELGEHLGLRRAELGVFRKFYGLDTLRFAVPEAARTALVDAKRDARQMKLL